MPTTSPALTLTIEDRGETAIVHCSGKLVLGVTDLLYTPVAALVPTHRRILLDLTGLTHMDSMGIGTLLRLYVHAKTHHSSIELRNIGSRIMELLVMANLLPVFTTIGEHGVRL
jgi:anti-anti-sigma factor